MEPKEVTCIAAEILGEMGNALQKVDGKELLALVGLIEQSPVIFAAASGRSGLVLGCAAMRLVHMGKRVHGVGEVTAPAIQEGELLLVVSGSGETESIVTKARKARSIGAKIGVITANRRSTLHQLADVAVHIDAPTPKAQVREANLSFQPMGNLFEQTTLIVLDAIIIELMNKTGTTARGMFMRHANLE